MGKAALCRRCHSALPPASGKRPLPAPRTNEAIASVLAHWSCLPATHVVAAARLRAASGAALNVHPLLLLAQLGTCMGAILIRGCIGGRACRAVDEAPRSECIDLRFPFAISTAMKGPCSGKVKKLLD